MARCGQGSNSNLGLMGLSHEDILIMKRNMKTVKDRSLVLPSESHPDPRIYVKYEDDTSEYIDGFKNGAYYLEESGCAVCLYRWVRLWRTGTL